MFLVSSNWRQHFIFPFGYTRLICPHLTGTKSKIIHEELPSDDPKQRKPDITLAKKYLGWEPKVPLAEGLKDTIAYFRDYLEGEK